MGRRGFEPRLFTCQKLIQRDKSKSIVLDVDIPSSTRSKSQRDLADLRFRYNIRKQGARAHFSPKACWDNPKPLSIITGGDGCAFQMKDKEENRTQDFAL